MIALLDYGAGNLRSVENALRAVGAEVEVTRDPEVVRRADQLVVPGQGSMRACADAMRASGCADALVEAVRRGTPTLGICVGLQMLFEEGE
ncbi:MAG: imidazole glycerol phosphate synthase subunit HisH, partial [Anaeromyxobacteraceae bacterium]